MAADLGEVLLKGGDRYDRRTIGGGIAAGRSGAELHGRVFRCDLVIGRIEDFRFEELFFLFVFRFGHRNR